MCPGWCRTDMGGPNAVKSAEDGAAMTMWLMSKPFEICEEEQGGYFAEMEYRGFVPRTFL